jgi:hypothetical protein
MISEREKNAADMTVEEFAQHIKMLSDEVMNFKDYFNPKDKRSNPRGTRTYMNSKRGNFHGTSQWLSLNCSMNSSKESIIRQTVSGLRELNNTVNTGEKRKSQMRIER